MNALIFLALTAPQAHAWQHTGMLWNRDVFPVPWYMSDHETKDLSSDYQVDVLDTSINAWERDAPCSELSAEYMGVRKGHWKSGSSSSDLLNTMYYDDPAGQNADEAIGVTYSMPSSDFAFEMRDPYDPTVTNFYYYTSDSDIVFSANYTFYTTDDVDQGLCQGNGYSIEAIATHEFGHFWGMDHSCGQDDVEAGDCNDPDWISATMFWTGPNCSNEANSLNSDDIQGITALYGPFATFDVAKGVDKFGGVPLEVCFQLETKGVDEAGGDLVIEWNFGDGTSSSDSDPCHTYTEKGQYTVSITVTGTSDSCGEYSYDYRKPAFVLACEAPQPAVDFDGMFSYEWVEGNTYQMLNQADLTVYGCVDQVQWDVFKDNVLQQSVNAWAPKIDFGAPGKYDIVLNLGGPGGVTAEGLTLTVGGEGTGCSAAPASASVGLFGLLLGLGAALRRRRKA